jgi:hypothetical protein
MLSCETVEIMTSKGGKRIGAGRKADPKAKKAYSTKLSQIVVRYLRSRENAAVTIEEHITQSKGFRQWQKSNKQ